jgi:hypothetical protein
MRVCDHFLGHGAEQQLCDRVSSMRADHQQVGRQIDRELDDAARHIPDADMTDHTLARRAALQIPAQLVRRFVQVIFE